MPIFSLVHLEFVPICVLEMCLWVGIHVDMGFLWEWNTENLLFSPSCSLFFLLCFVLPSLLHFFSLHKSLHSLVEMRRVLDKVIERVSPLVELWADLVNCRCLIFSPLLGRYTLPTLPTVGAISGTQCWERKVLLRPPGWYMWLNPVSLFIDFKILMGRLGGLLILKLPRIHLIPCLWNWPPTTLDWPAPLSLVSSCPLCMGAS